MSQAIFLSYASQDADAARRICEALRAAGLEVWFDQSELRGGDAWDASIRKQIKECSLFVPIISNNTQRREEGYFRLEWKLAVDRSHLMADNKAFFFPVILGDVAEPAALVPDKFRERQWTRLHLPHDAQIRDDAALTTFAERIAKLVAGSASSSKNASNSPPVLVTDQDSHYSRAVIKPSGNEGGEGVVDGVQSTSAPATPPTPTPTPIASHKRRNTLLLAAGAALMLAIATAAYFYFPRTFQQNTAEPITSIAVLPFQIKGNEADADYLGEGLAESLIHRLSQLPKLRVSPTSSAFRFKGNDVDPIKAGNDLNVGAVMTGRILQRGDNFTISVELIDVRNKASLWGEKYERRQSELLTTQREMATEITRKLQLKLSGEDTRLLAKRYTESNDAYQLYLQGRYQYAKRGKDNLAHAVTFFEQAVSLDPNFALAYVGLADAYSIAAFIGYRTAVEALPLARAAAAQALQVDATLADAHAANASIAAMSWRWDEAERGFRRALELNPDVSEIRTRHALLWLLPLGRADEAITELKRALELDPLSVVTGAMLARAYLQAGQTERSLEQARKAYTLDSANIASRRWLGMTLIASGKYDEALALVDETKVVVPGMLEMAAFANAKAGRREATMRQLAAMEAQPATFSAYWLAGSHAVLGNRDAAFAALERAVLARETQVVFLKVEGQFASLRGDPRYDALLKRIGLAK